MYCTCLNQIELPENVEFAIMEFVEKFFSNQETCEICGLPYAE